MSGVAIGETVIVKGVVGLVGSSQMPVLCVQDCKVIEIVRIAPKLGDVVKSKSVPLGVVTKLSYNVAQPRFEIDGKPAIFTELEWPTEQEMKEYQLKKLADFSEDDLFAEILRRKDAKLVAKKEEEARNRFVATVSSDGCTAISGHATSPGNLTGVGFNCLISNKI